MAMWKYLKRYDEKIFENIFFEILILPYFRKFSHSKISTYTVKEEHKQVKIKMYAGTDGNSLSHAHYRDPYFDFRE